MTPRIQHPIDSVFDKSSTAIEVIGGLCLTGKNAVITGRHSGLGLESAKALWSSFIRNTIESCEYVLFEWTLFTSTNTRIKGGDYWCQKCFYTPIQFTGDGCSKFYGCI